MENEVNKTWKMINKFLISTAAGILMFGVLAVSVFADSVSVNFEPPIYTLGNINGQDGWSKTGRHDVKVSDSFSYSTFGVQSLRVSDAVTSSSFGDQTFAKPLINAVGEAVATQGIFSVGIRQTHFEMQFDLASTLATLQTGMHVSVSPDRGDGSAMSYLRFEDQQDGIHIFFNQVKGTSNPANFVEEDISTVSRSNHKIKLTLDTLNDASNDVVKVYVDGLLKVTGTSWENYYRFDSRASAEPSPRIVKTVLFRESGTANSENSGRGFLIDNLSLLSSSISLLTDKNQCNKDGWKTFNGPTFNNQADCVSFVQSYPNTIGNKTK